jgi:hypothetical protein
MKNINWWTYRIKKDALKRGILTHSSGCEVDHSPPTSAEVKKMWIYTSTPPYAFMA